MAAEKPVVSTPITDVVRSFGEVVFVAQNIAGFILACEAALVQPAAERQRMVQGMRSVLAHTSWDATAQAMDALIAQALARRPS